MNTFFGDWSDPYWSAQLRDDADQLPMIIADIILIHSLRGCVWSKKCMG